MTPQRQLDAFIDRFSPDVARVARAALRKMRTRLPGAVQMVYDNYNALAIGFCPTGRASDAVFSIAVYPRWVSLFFFDGVNLADPNAVLEGSGKRARHVVLDSAADLDTPAIRALMAEAMRRADPPFAKGKKSALLIKSVSAAQRPRRVPAPAAPLSASRRRR